MSDAAWVDAAWVQDIDTFYGIPPENRVKTGKPA